MKCSQLKKIACAVATAGTLCVSSSTSVRAGDAYATAVEALNPVIYYKLNEAPTSVQTYWATNLGSAGAMANGVYLGSGFTEPYFPGAILGDTNDGAASFAGGPYSTGVSIPWSTNINPAPAFSTECWVNYQGTPGSELTAPFASIDAGNNRAGWTIYANGNSWNFRMGDADGYVANIDDSGLIQPGVWVHLVGVADGTNAYLYENGVLEAMTVVVRPFLGNIGETTDIGTSTSFNRQIEAAVDECAIYNYALTTNQIAAHYAAGINPTPGTAYKTVILGDHPVGYWRLDDGAAPAATTGPSAVNSGTLGATADGVYLPGSQVGVSGVPFPGFGSDTNAAYFNGVMSGIQIPAINVQTDSVTYTCWIQSTAIQEGNAGWPGYAPLITQGAVYGYTADDPVFLGYWADGETLSALWFDGTTNPAAIADYGLLPAAKPAPFVWNFVACVWTPTGTIIYVNGQPNPIPGAGPHTTHDFSSAPLFIGADDTINSAGNYAGSTQTGTLGNSDWIFEGYMAHPAVFASALTSNQIQGLYTAAAPLPQITSLTESPPAPNYDGQTITLTVATIQPGSPTFQWQNGGVTISGQTAPSFVLSNVTSSDSGAYAVVVSDSYGSVTSAPITINVQATKPIIVAQPLPATRYPASSATFSVSAIGSTPISYAWSLNSTPIAGATNSSYTAVAGTSTAGNYSVVLTNALGSTPSGDALLTVLPTPIGYVGAVAAAQPTAYWRLDETSGLVAYDYAGGYNGGLNENVTNDVPGPVFPGLPSNNVSCAFDGVGSKIRCPAIPVNSNTITIVALAQQSASITTPAGACIFVSSYGANDIAYLGVGIGGGGSSTDLQYNWNSDANTYDFDPGNSGTNWIFPPGTWCFVAETIGFTNAVLYMDDGDGHLAAATNSLTSSMTIITNDVLPLNIEVDIGGNANLNTGDNATWGGGLDQIAYWKRTLSYQEIAALHKALLTPIPSVSAAVSGTNILISFGGGSLQSSTNLSTGFTDVPGSPTSPYTPPPGSPAQFFRVKN